jgi:sugar lactone lactonase YvrE
MVLVALVAVPAAPAAAQQLPDTLHIEAPGLHPEGVAWDEDHGRFLVTSVTQGVVTAVGDDGSLETVVDDPDLRSAIGIHLDPERGRMLVANSDLAAVQGESAPGIARLGIYDLADGERIHMVELGPLHPDGRHFANDVTVGPDGAAYVTDSFSPVIYRVAPDGAASVFARDSLLGAEGFGLNGIDVHPDGYLLVAVAGRRTLVRVPLDDPSSMAEVELSEPFSADGIVLRADGALVAVARTGSGDEASSEALLLRSDDGWTSAEIVDRAPAPGGTTAAVRDGQVWVVNPRFGEMGGDEPVPSFPLYRVPMGR